MTKDNTHNVLDDGTLNIQQMEDSNEPEVYQGYYYSCSESEGRDYGEYVLYDTSGERDCLEDMPGAHGR